MNDMTGPGQAHRLFRPVEALAVSAGGAPNRVEDYVEMTRRAPTVDYPWPEYVTTARGEDQIIPAIACDYPPEGC